MGLLVTCRVGVKVNILIHCQIRRWDYKYYNCKSCIATMKGVRKYYVKTFWLTCKVLVKNVLRRKRDETLDMGVTRPVV